MNKTVSERAPWVSVVVTALTLLVPLELQAQGGTITGRVIDANTAQPVAAAQVSIQDLGIGALTQQNGRFTLSNVAAGSYTISVQLIGYHRISEPITVV